MNTVVVTGAAGFVGRWTLPMLTARGFAVHALTSRTPPPDTPGVQWHRVDLLNPGEAGRAVANLQPTHLLHLAWFAEHSVFWTSPLNLRWVQASLDLIQAFQRAGGRRMVTAGTCVEYGRCDDRCSETTTPLNPSTLYGACKHALQLMTTAFAEQNDMSSAWGRVFYLFGPHEQSARLVPSVIRALLQNQPARCSHGNQVRDFLHVQDVASAFVALLSSDVTGPVNIASGVPTTVRQVVETIGRELDRLDLIQLGAIASPQGESPVLVADTHRLASEVGWRPAYSLQSGLERTIEWSRAAASPDHASGVSQMESR